MKPDPSKKTAEAIVGKKSVADADQCRRVAGVVQLTDSEVPGHGIVRKLVQDPYCLAFVFPDLPDDGSNVAITCPSPVTRSMRQFLNACDHKSCTTVSDLARSI